MPADSRSDRCDRPGLRIFNAGFIGTHDARAMRYVMYIFLSLVLIGCEADAPLVPQAEVHALAERGETALLMQALDADGSIDRRDACYRTPLMFAAQFGHVHTVRELLGAGARVDLHEKGYYSALMLAAGNGHTEVVRLLAAAGASVDDVEITHRWTALIWAAKRGHRDTVELLLELGADREARDDRGWSARDWALNQGHQATAALL
jgi:ankyrin repeat protein